MTKDSEYIVLLHRKLNKSIDQQEQLQLEGWLSASAENKILAEEIEQTWHLTESYQENYQPEVESSLLKLKSRIEAEKEEEEEKPVHQMPRRIWVARIAAAIILLFGIGAVIGYFMESRDVENWASVETRPGSSKEIVLDDGSIVWLNENSRLEYPASFDGDLRLVKLSGEAFFDIKRDEKRTFLIKTGQAAVKVLGTSFNVRSYDSEEDIEVTVKTGKVEFGMEGIGQPLIALPSDCYRYNKREKKYSKQTDKEMNALSWQTRQLVFRNTAFSEVIRNLERCYGIGIEVQDKELKNCSLTARFDNTPLPDVLEILKASFSIELQSISKNRFLFTGGRCN